MKYTYDIKDGPIADRILRELRHLSARDLLDMSAKGDIQLYSSNYELSYKSLKLSKLEQYATATGTPVINFLFDDIPLHTYYTPNDDTVLNFLKRLNVYNARKYLALFTSLFENPLLKLSGTPCNKLLEVIHHRKNGEKMFALDPFEVPEYKVLSKDILPELTRWRNSGRQTSKFNIHSEYLTDLATFYGVSVHWLLNLTMPFYCSNREADRIFDLYTLLTASEQELFCRIIEELSHTSRKEADG